MIILLILSIFFFFFYGFTLQRKGHTKITMIMCCCCWIEVGRSSVEEVVFDGFCNIVLTRPRRRMNGPSSREDRWDYPIIYNTIESVSVFLSISPHHQIKPNLPSSSSSSATPHWIDWIDFDTIDWTIIVVSDRWWWLCEEEKSYAYPDFKQSPLVDDHAHRAQHNRARREIMRCVMEDIDDESG